MTVAWAGPARDGRGRSAPATLEAAHGARGETALATGTDDWGKLLAAAISGDHRAFARFLRETTPTIRAVVRAKAGSLPADLQEDVVQDVLIAIHLKRHTWRAGTPARPWVHAIARYKAIDARRRRAVQPAHVPIDAVPELRCPAPHAGDAGTPVDDDRALDALLGQIDDRSARLVRAVALGGETTEAAGARLGWRAGAARVALHRAVKKLTALNGDTER
jgi:RNA polymerase sigma-70 factor (ECF subfamily)